MNSTTQDLRTILISLTVFVASWAALMAQDVAAPFTKDVVWTGLFHGVDHAEIVTEKPRLMRGQVVRVDLKADGIRLLATPAAKDNPERTLGLKTSSFLIEHRCQVAINGSSFMPVRFEEGKEQSIDGLHISNGKVVSKGNGKYDALLFSKTNKAWLAAPPFEVTDVETAVGGFQIVLKNGKVPDKLPDYNKGTLHPRSAAGISAEGRFLFLLAIDGRQEKWSQGASIQEVGHWLKQLGAADGINLDGGGTTTLVVAEPNGKARVLNRPIQANKPGNERVSGSHLGIYANPKK